MHLPLTQGVSKVTQILPLLHSFWLPAPLNATQDPACALGQSASVVQRMSTHEPVNPPGQFASVVHETRGTISLQQSEAVAHVASGLVWQNA